MIIDDKRIDDAFTERRTRPESSDELAQMQRVFPDPIPATHIWEYRWEQPDATTLKKNPRTLPTLVQGVRELTLAEVRKLTKDFSTLGLGELRWLQERHGAPMLPLEKGAPRKEELPAIREALLAHIKASGGKDAAVKPAVQSQGDNASPGAVVLPEDIAAMNEAGLETEAAKLGLHDDFTRMSRVTLPNKRAWLAGKRAELGKLVPA